PDKTITVQNVAPTLTVTGAVTTAEGAAYTVTLGRTDPGADTISGWTIDWGDGVVDNLPGTATGATHAYADDAPSRTIVTTATDEDGTWSAPNKTISVSNLPPIALLDGPTAAQVGQAATYTLGATDPSSVDLNSNFTFGIDW